MKFLLLVSAFALAGFLGLGCASSEPAKFEATVHSWVPLGTPLKKAEDVMKHHGFECRVVKADDLRFNSTGKTYLECDRPNVYLHNWHVRLYSLDDKVSEYGDIIVD